MSEIRSGDLVMVVRPMPCCGCCHALGRVFTVAEIYGGDGTCDRCNCVYYSIDARDGDSNDPDEWFPISTLRRLDPDALKDDIPQRDEVSA